MTFEELLDKKWGDDVSDKDIIACHEEVKEVFAFSIKTLICADFVPGRTRVWLNDDGKIEAIVLELKNGQHIRTEKPQPKDFTKRMRGPTPRDALGWW